MDGKDAPGWRLLRQGQGYTPGSGADERRGCTPRVFARKKTWYELLRAGASNITPAPSTDTCGQCHSTEQNAGQAGETAIALRRAQRKHQTTRWHSPAQDVGADKSAAPVLTQGIGRVNSPFARTYPKSKTRFALTRYIFVRSPRWGAAREALTSVLSKIGSPLPLPEQPKTPAHERANIRGRAFFHSISQRPVDLRQKHSSTPMISFHIYPSRTPESL